ncbi:NAD(P)/FAD-dependent oxidoreductase [Rhodoblastus sp.]|uniref:NAD(P)/FAD-dependent oxidoreductase n=1 Tax=Rhodoblastus sp. TaxID=1962975 RepID=UPI00260D4F77|nr:NAD(P)/FAD-dependent oxidoreductase [Rhodoblastus sp.]
MDSLPPPCTIRQRIAVIGAGVSGLSCAWVLSRHHDVVLYEAEQRLGGHANTRTIDAGGRDISVDTGFIVYNEPTYPNLSALFAHIGVESVPTDMSFSVSLDRGAYEYAGKGLRGLFAQPRNAFRSRFWSMIGDLLRFYREAPRDLPQMGDISLDAYLARGRYGEAFIRDHLYPMAAAIWSTPAAEVGAFPAASFIRFCDNHGLLKLARRPVWRTLRGGSRQYIEKLAEGIGEIRLGAAVMRVARRPYGVEVRDARGGMERFDAIVIAAHADTALAMLETPSLAEREILGAFRYSGNIAFLHSDPSLMPRRRAAWASWNYLAESGGPRGLAVTYWMNRLQPLGAQPQLFVTLNPSAPPRENAIFARDAYRHPQFDLAALDAQRRLWSLQGADRIWFCGAYFGAGFHEDGLQAGLAVAEQLGGHRRPWVAPNENGRIVLEPAPRASEKVE